MNTKFDKFLRGEVSLSPAEANGFNIFMDESRGDCFHCHPLAGMQFSDYQLHNNGLDSVFTDLGRGEVTGDPDDYGRFKTPSLRNYFFN